MSEWETFCHGSYNLWRVRRKNERGVYTEFHRYNEREARELVELLNRLDRERDEARDQRNRLHELHNQNAMRHNELLELCVTLREELDEARVALMEIEDRCVDCEDACDDIQKIRDIAVKALGGAK